MKKTSFVIMGLSLTFILIGCGTTPSSSSSTPSSAIPTSSTPTSSNPTPSSDSSNSPIIEGYEYKDTHIDYEKDGDGAIVYQTSTFTPLDNVQYYQSVEGKKGNE